MLPCKRGQAFSGLAFQCTEWTPSSSPTSARPTAAHPTMLASLYTAPIIDMEGSIRDYHMDVSAGQIVS